MPYNTYPLGPFSRGDFIHNAESAVVQTNVLFPKPPVAFFLLSFFRVGDSRLGNSSQGVCYRHLTININTSIKTSNTIYNVS